MKILVGVVFILSVAQSTCEARTLQDLGPTFEIQENSLLDVLTSRMQAAKESGKLDEIEAEVKSRVTKKAMHPSPVKDISDAHSYRRYYFDPTITVDEDIKDHRGVVIHHKGKRLNPLHYVSWGAPMMFVNGDNEDQVNWATKESESHGGKIVLVKGSPIELYRKTGVRFYFDQAGKITSQLGIRHVPAKVSQDGYHLDGERLLIEEFVLKNKGEQQ